MPPAAMNGAKPSGGTSAASSECVFLELPGDDLTINLGADAEANLNSEKEWIWGIPGVTRFKDAPLDREAVFQRKHSRDRMIKSQRL
eukprot:g6889.t1